MTYPLILSFSRREKEPGENRGARGEIDREELRQYLAVQSGKIEATAVVAVYDDAKDDNSTQRRRDAKKCRFDCRRFLPFDCLCAFAPLR